MRLSGAMRFAYCTLPRFTFLLSPRTIEVGLPCVFEVHCRKESGSGTRHISVRRSNSRCHVKVLSHPASLHNVCRLESCSCVPCVVSCSFRMNCTVATETNCPPVMTDSHTPGKMLQNLARSGCDTPDNLVCEALQTQRRTTSKCPQPRNRGTGGSEVPAPR